MDRTIPVTRDSQASGLLQTGIARGFRGAIRLPVFPRQIAKFHVHQKVNFRQRYQCLHHYARFSAFLNARSQLLPFEF